MGLKAQMAICEDEISGTDDEDLANEYEEIYDALDMAVNALEDLEGMA